MYILHMYNQQCLGHLIFQPFINLKLYTRREKQSSIQSRAVGIVLFQSCVQYFNLTGVLHQLSLNLNWLHMFIVDTSTMDLKQGFVSPIIEIQV